MVVSNIGGRYFTREFSGQIIDSTYVSKFEAKRLEGTWQPHELYERFEVLYRLVRAWEAELGEYYKSVWNITKTGLELVSVDICSFPEARFHLAAFIAQILLEYEPQAKRIVGTNLQKMRTFQHSCILQRRYNSYFLFFKTTKQGHVVLCGTDAEVVDDGLCTWLNLQGRVPQAPPRKISNARREVSQV